MYKLIVANKRRLLALGAILLLAVLWLAAAQQPPDGVDVTRPSTWFVSAAAWGFVTRFAIAFLKANVLKSLSGMGTVVAGAALSIVGAILASTGVLNFLGIDLDASFGEAISFGVAAFLTAAGSYDTQAQAQAKALEIRALSVPK